ncbi:MAG: thioredoxin family protein [Desulfobacula sp.]|nr:thioredoxin family protein [Desulfobacula sp.]MCK5163243.1 thioredoxin family protein [Desulfobacula sp.]
MKTKIIIFILASSFLLTLPIQTFAASSGIKWQNYEQGISMAKEQEKKIFLYFHADWCKYCKKMGSTTFKNAQVIDLLNKQFISIQIDSEKQKKIAYKYGVRGLPASWFLEKDATRINTLPGYVDGPIFALILQYIKTNSFQKMSFQEFTKTL